LLRRLAKRAGLRKNWEAGMEITEVRIFSKEDASGKLKAYATITIDNVFVVRNIKIIEGKTGLFIAMPSRKIKEPCPKCNHKNTIHSKFCNECGSQLPAYIHSAASLSPEAEHDLRQAEHKDIAHPITIQAREYIQKKILDAYQAEKAKQQGL